MPKQLGIVFKAHNEPETLIPFVKAAEQLGFAEVWIVEDCFFAGGIASVATALASTERIVIGLGIMPAVARNVAFAAMEIAALGRLFPSRFLAGFGHGVGEWMRQIGAFPDSQLAALEEVTMAARALLAGEDVDFDGKHVQLSHVKLEFPPKEVPSVSLGVRGPKSLQLSGRVADGTILTEYSSSAYIAWAREQIKIGQRQAGRESETHRVTVYSWCVVAENRDQSMQTLRAMADGWIKSGKADSALEHMGISDGVDTVLTDELLVQLAVIGTPTECRDAILKLEAAGVDRVILVPIEDDAAGDAVETMERIAAKILPLLEAV